MRPSSKSVLRHSASVQTSRSIKVGRNQQLGYDSAFFQQLPHQFQGGVRSDWPSTSRDLAFSVDCWLKAAGTLIRVSAGSSAFLSQRFFAGTRFLRVMLIEMRSVFAF